MSPINYSDSDSVFLECILDLSYYGEFVSNSRTKLKKCHKDLSIQSMTLYGSSTTKPPVTRSTKQNKYSLPLIHQIDNTIPGGGMRLNKRGISHEPSQDKLKANKDGQYVLVGLEISSFPSCPSIFNHFLIFIRGGNILAN